MKQKLYRVPLTIRMCTRSTAYVDVMAENPEAAQDEASDLLDQSQSTVVVSNVTTEEWSEIDIDATELPTEVNK